VSSDRPNGVKEPIRTTEPYRPSIDKVDDLITSQLGKSGLEAVGLRGLGWKESSLACCLAVSTETLYLSAQRDTAESVGDPRLSLSMTVALLNRFAPPPTLKVTRGYLVRLHDNRTVTLGGCTLHVGQM
jgi:hypothetical protein